MRYLAPIALVLLAGCSSSPSAEDSARTSSASVTPAIAGDASDTACQVVLRHTYINFESSLGPQTDCSSGTCWVVITVTFDVAMSQSLAGSEAFVLYQGEGSTGWQQSPPAQPVLGCDELPDGPCAPVGFRRYQVVLRTGTFTSGPGDQTVRLIPFLGRAGGAGRLFDHNRVADPMGNYVLDANDNWTIGDDASTCPGTTPAGRLMANFATGWQNSSSGTLVGGGKLDVSYDIYRMPQSLCTTDGVAAFSTNGYVQFQPSGQVLMEVVSGPFDSTKNQYASIPLEFDVPPGTTSAALWFYTSSDCSAPQWDSDYGRNYVFTAQ
jgi:hypothetical protein